MPDQPRPTDPITGFAAKTPIRTHEGSTSIENVKPGDLILTPPDKGHGHQEPEDHDDDRTGEEDRWWEWN
jgi:hypothetical protein